MTFKHDSWIHFEIYDGVYGLKQTGKLATDLLLSRLGEHGHYQCAITPGLCPHCRRLIIFVLSMDNFGIQYVEKCHDEHLLSVLQMHYTIATDWSGAKFACIDLTLDYTKCTCGLSMQGYIQAHFIKYNPSHLHNPQHSPHAYIPITFGKTYQLSQQPDHEPVLLP